MEQQITLDELYKCCEALFPEDIVLSDDFINCLRPEGLKAAFRSKVKETHPDKLKAIGTALEDPSDRFRRTVEAYETLLPLVTDGLNASCLKQTGKSEEPPKEKFELYHDGAIPRIKLRFSQYLYYRGLVSWRDCISSLTWQRNNRPLFGQIAANRGWLNAETANLLIRHAKHGERFGETAQRLNLLSQKQILFILGHQSSFRAAVGVYFLGRGILNDDSLKQLLRDFYFHNFKISCTGNS
jgi:hypothetical protein